ncbi:MAG TPA: leucyl aminopeptidase [Ktedonobacterales bacterium]
MSVEVAGEVSIPAEVSSPEVRISTRDALLFEGDAVAVGVFAGADHLEGPAAALDGAMVGAIESLRARGEITGAADEVTLVHTLGKIDLAWVAVVGLGPRDRFNADRIRRVSAIACRTLRRAGARHVGLALAWAESGVNLALAARAATEGALTGLYRFDRYKSVPETEAHSEPESGAMAEVDAGMKSGANGALPPPARRALDAITILSRGREAVLRAAIERGRMLAEATNWARDLGNEPPNVLTPTALAERARAMAERVGLACEVLGPEQMERLGMGALLGVARGSAEPPRLIILRYRGGPAHQPGLALVGKGITFDSGGISIKPAEHMDDMKMDMLGGAAVLGAMRAIAELKPAINVTGLVPTTENMPGGRAYHPGDILRASNGTTIEILNTDAEGRLILADALAHAVRLGLAPIVDAATLTGAVGVALGPVRAGLFCNDADLQRLVQQAGETSGDRVWPMPMDPEYDELIRSEIADVKQTGGRQGSAILAAKVLSRFVGDRPWAHLDIANVAWRAERKPDAERGAMGVGVRLFVELASLLAERPAKG